MPMIGGGAVAPDLGTFIHTAAPTAGTNAVQTLVIAGSPNGGTFTLTLAGHTTSAITWSNNATTLVSAVDTAVEALPNVGTGGVTAANSTLNAGVGNITITFNGQFTARRVWPTMTATSSLTGTNAAVSISTTTNGVAATFVDAPKGARLVDTNTGVVYVNTGADANPTWTVVGTQT